MKQAPANHDASEALKDLLSLAQMQMQLLEDRTQGIHARGVGLAGFASVVLSLLALAVSSDVRAVDAPKIPETAKYMLVGALVLLATAVGLIVGAIWPYHRNDITAGDLDKWRRGVYSAGRTEDGVSSAVRKHALERLSQAIGAAQEINHRKAKFLHWGGILVVVAMALSAAASAVIAL